MAKNTEFDEALGRVAGPTRQSVEQTLTDAQRAFRGDRKREQQRMLDENDSEYWVCIYWRTREEKEDFLAKARLLELGDKYLDGREVAERMGISLAAGAAGRSVRHRIDPAWTELI